ncbi:unnamed protein product [Cylicocyclus nassatus]|uniref:HTH CENPB-type domain-containing protein n=1 Tax=Cylicocyclus nassatus TaxID=53992 RepID=A0AA36GY02_CYLNA|nr:unnamed protein product [Cylicocyclus nassatus]
MVQLRRRTYTAAFKLTVVTYATSINLETGEENGNRAAAKEFGVDESLVRRWKKNANVLQAMDENKRANRFKRPQWPELEERVKEWVLEQRAEKRKVSTISIRLEAKRLADDMGIVDFNGGSSWCYNFMRRADLSMRASTSVGQHLPTNADELVASFRSFVKAKITTILAKDIGNMDEVPVTFDMPRRYTVDIRGTQDYQSTDLGNERTNFTVVLGVTADGGICPPMVIFEKKKRPQRHSIRSHCEGKRSRVDERRIAI